MFKHQLYFAVSFLLLACWAAIAAAESPDAPPKLRPIDEGRARAAGIRKLTGQRLTLYTDLASSPAVDELPAVFDQAFGQWCAYFGVDEKQHPQWKMLGFLMKDKARFEASGLLPGDLPPFLNGFSRGHELWLYSQTSDYYRRHLLLHEGTHGFMNTLLGGCGPPWYAEGMAELLATHRWNDGRLTLNAFPAKASDVPKLGRIEIVEHDVARSHLRPLGEVLNYDAHAHLKVEPYGWSWAAVAFLDGHPRYRERFRKLWKQVGDEHFNRRFAEAFKDDAAELTDEWQVFASDLTYGYDFNRTAIDFTAGKPLTTHLAKITVAVDRGWQNSGIELAGGKTYRLQAAGRYQVAKDPRVWWSEPGGVSIRYFHGRPLGVLLAALRGDSPAGGTSPFATPVVVGLGTTVRPTKSGTLYFRTNIPAGEFDLSAGKLTVEISSD